MTIFLVWTAFVINVEVIGGIIAHSIADDVGSDQGTAHPAGGAIWPRHMETMIAGAWSNFLNSALNIAVDMSAMKRSDRYG
ncbi:hypothetical protein K9B33_21940, partial [Sphingobium sp. 3R8]|uniref:hypothetical protein n=1 Tax=Sphingobium sp. 3R8 TaxID=2874921 RepID=UPI001CCBCDF2